MTVVSNDPIWWHAINNGRTCSYFIVAASVGVIYDSALTFAQEVELFWLRYIGIVYAVESSDISDDRYRFNLMTAIVVILCTLRKVGSMWSYLQCLVSSRSPGYMLCIGGLERC
ncbi:hypothetical protein BDR07DRAFT_1380994 [Suillus spraguei]|nr:hypothetical protein BDR07DRAFT_1380994 [Suillus spraguei]